MSKILIVEDDSEIALLERDYLEIEGLESDVVSDGESAVSAALSGGYDLVLLDLMLPGLNGYDVCRQIRDRVDVPILMVTARTDSVDKIRGLGLGADDYIAKPFDPAELVARVKAHLSRYARLTGSGGRQAEQEVIVVGDLQILPRSWKVYKGERELKLLEKKSGKGCCCTTSDDSRQYVENQWSYSTKNYDEGEMTQTDALDEFLTRIHNETFAVSGMIFQDAWNLDLDRLKRCYICEVDPDYGMVPFCAYNLTNLKGTYLYRK